jgi:rubrerythrin
MRQMQEALLLQETVPHNVQEMSFQRIPPSSPIPVPLPLPPSLSVLPSTVSPASPPTQGRQEQGQQQQQQQQHPHYFYSQQQHHSVIEREGSNGALAAVQEVEEYERRHRCMHEQEERQRKQERERLQRSPSNARSSSSSSRKGVERSNLSSSSKRNYPTPWACQACTYLHTDHESLFVRCAICGALK